DAEGEAVRIALMEQFDELLADPHRRLARLLARAAREGGGIEQEERIDIGGIIELAAAMLAERDDREAARRLARRALLDRGGERAFEAAVGEIGERGGQPLESDQTCKIADPERRRQRISLAPQRCGEIRRICA